MRPNLDRERVQDAHVHVICLCCLCGCDEVGGVLVGKKEGAAAL
jgi:hypothetical protein